MENGNPDPGAARVTGVVLGGAGGPGFDLTSPASARRAFLVDGFAQSMG